MKTYSPVISLNHNSRGVYCLDPTIGCASGMYSHINGCYGDCYAAKSAKIYGYDFSKTVIRNFLSKAHEQSIKNRIGKIDLDFIRMGCSGDPSEAWDHTLLIIDKIKNCGKEVVIITRHWQLLSDYNLSQLKEYRICINTSVSALDNEVDLERSITQYNRLKPYCKSILRVVSCDFNKNNEIGMGLSIIQDSLLKNESVIDTIFRPSTSSELISSGIINAKHGVFMGSKQLLSKHNKKTYAGKCSRCVDMCGQNMNPASYINNSNIPLFKQISLLKP